MSYYRLELWFDWNKGAHKSGKYKLDWGLAEGAVEYTGVYTVVHKTVGGDGHKTITIPDGGTSYIDILVFDTTGDTTVRTLNSLTLSFNQNSQPAYPFGGAQALRNGILGANCLSSTSNNAWGTTIYSKGGKTAQQGWEIPDRFQAFGLTGDFEFVGNVQVTSNGVMHTFFFDPDMDIDG